MPQVWRSSVGLDYADSAGFKYRGSDVHDQNTEGRAVPAGEHQGYDPKYCPHDKDRQQPIYSGTADVRISTLRCVFNTQKGYRYSLPVAPNRASLQASRRRWHIPMEAPKISPTVSVTLWKAGS